MVVAEWVAGAIRRMRTMGRSVIVGRWNGSWEKVVVSPLEGELKQAFVSRCYQVLRIGGE